MIRNLIASVGVAAILWMWAGPVVLGSWALAWSLRGWSPDVHSPFVLWLTLFAAWTMSFPVVVVVSNVLGI